MPPKQSSANQPASSRRPWLALPERFSDRDGRYQVTSTARHARPASVQRVEAWCAAEGAGP